MAVKNTAQVIIGGKIITLGGYESEEYFQQVASYMNKKIGELETVPGYGRQPMETKHMLLSLNITDDYFKAKKQVETYELDLQQKDQEMYDLKHELISPFACRLKKHRRMSRKLLTGRIFWKVK